MYINSLFVGANNLYIQATDNLAFKKNEASIDELKKTNISTDGKNSITEAGLGTDPSGEISKRSGGEVDDYQVLGMISQNKELFLFENPVLIQNDDHTIKEVEGYDVSGAGTGNVEQWLRRVEITMQDTMRKQMKYAVKSFSTRSLDEWVLDYPQQIIITALNLILSNEINDILEEK
jgi:hypothetical protein